MVVSSFSSFFTFEKRETRGRENATNYSKGSREVLGMVFRKVWSLNFP